MISWNSVLVAIPTVASRRPMFELLKENIERECSGAVLTTHCHPDQGDPRDDFPALMDRAAWSSREWILQLEDDVWLAPGFGVSALSALAHVAESGAAAATLFSRSRRDIEMLRAGQRWRRQAPSSFCMMQAVFVRSRVMRGFAEWAPSWYAAHPEHRGRAADLLFGAWISRNRLTMLAHVPSLVQHRAVPSTIPGHHGARQSETYRMVFGDVP
jgi:hypothetical protein